MIPVLSGRRYRATAVTLPAGVEVRVAFYARDGSKISMLAGEVVTAPAFATHANLMWPAGAVILRQSLEEVTAPLSEILTTGRAARRRASRLDRKPCP